MHSAEKAKRNLLEVDDVLQQALTNKVDDKAL